MYDVRNEAKETVDEPTLKTHINPIQKDAGTAQLLYMFRVSIAPIIMSR